MKKIESDYRDLYGDIPLDKMERLDDLFKECRNKKNGKRVMLNDLLCMEWDEVNFVIYLVPKATPRPRCNRVRNTFYVIGAKDNKDIFEKFMVKQHIDMITTPCKFYCDSYLPIPKSMKPEEKVLAEMGYIRPISKPDWDNLGKTYSDMIQKTLLFDDSLIIEGSSKKFYSTKPRIEIRIEYMKKYDSLYNEQKMRKKVKI